MSATLARAIYWSKLKPTQYVILVPDPKDFRSGELILPVETLEFAREMIGSQLKWMQENHPTRQMWAVIIRDGVEIERFGEGLKKPVPVFVVQESELGYRYQLTDAGRAAAAAIRAELEAAERVEIRTFQPRSVDEIPFYAESNDAGQSTTDASAAS
jgi:hypothetical protein